MSVELWDSPQDYIVLAGQRSPGTAEVSDGKASYNYLIREAPFATGARMLFKRRDLSKFTVRLHLFTREDLEALEAWRPIIDTVPGPRKQANALDIVHPALNTLGITSCVVLEVRQLEADGFGGFYLTILFQEFKGLPVVSQAKVEAAKDTPLDPVDQEILTKTKTLESTLEELAK